MSATNETPMDRAPESRTATYPSDVHPIRVPAGHRIAGQWEHPGGMIYELWFSEAGTSDLMRRIRARHAEGSLDDDDLNALESEKTALRAQVDTLFDEQQRLNEENVNLRAELAESRRLQATAASKMYEVLKNPDVVYWHQKAEHLEAELTPLRAELATLREALERILGVTPDHSPPEEEASAVAFARQVLSSTPESALKRWEAMGRVAEVAKAEREKPAHGLPREILDALDALAALERGEGRG